MPNEEPLLKRTCGTWSEDSTQMEPDESLTWRGEVQRPFVELSVAYQSLLSGGYKQTNKRLRCGSRAGLLGQNDQTHHRMEPKQMAPELIQKQKSYRVQPGSESTEVVM
jgi:hypothetical protein